MLTVSVIIPIYNEAREDILITLESVQRAASYAGHTEIVVVDDGSDEDKKVWTLPRDVLRVDCPHRGIAATLNTGVLRSTGSFVTTCGIGDYFSEHRISRCRHEMIDQNIPALFHGFVTDDGVFAVHDDWRRRLAHDNQFSLGAAMWSREVAKEHLFDESLQWCVDWDFAARVQFLGPGWGYLPEVLSEAFQRPDGHTRRAMADTQLNMQRSRDRATVARRWRKARKWA